MSNIKKIIGQHKTLDEDLVFVKDLYKKIGSNSEFEFMFYNFNNRYLGFEKYISLLKFMTNRAKAQNLETKTENVLDIVMNADDANYRITISSIGDINKVIEPFHKYQNHVTFKTLAKQAASKKDKNITIMKKKRDAENVYDITDYNIRVRLSEELDVSKKELDDIQKIDYNSAKKITFRLKQRVSFFMKNNLRVDMTITKMSKQINRINTSVPNYELELELMRTDKDNIPKDTSYLDKMINESLLLLKVIQQSNFITTNSVEDMVIVEYAKIIGKDPETIIGLEARQPWSLEIQHVTEMLSNRYAVTDKADGDRYFMIIIANHVYFISGNLHVKDSGIVLDDKLSKYNGTILDGELIFLPTKNRHLFMAFDCLFNGTQDIRKTLEFMNRLKQADDIIDNCFILNKQKGYKIKDYSNPTGKEFNLDLVAQFHENQIKEYMQTINHDVEVEKKYPLIRRKYFIACVGAKSWEIFKYSTLLWNKYTNDPETKTPYLLDGLVYHPLLQDYNTTRDSKLAEFKWKPPEKNSIDFYITFEHDKQTGKVLTVYDNSNEEHVRNKPYKICNLQVGKQGRQGEEPVLFRELENGYLAHLFLKDGEAVDIDGNLLSDKTVVEFYYDTNPELDDKFRWIPLRTRYDKTESVQKYGRKYGNYIDTAMKVWRSMINPILMSDFLDLARGNDEKSGIYYYDIKLDNMRKKISHELIIAATRENQYFQVRTNLAKPMREFHNWVKSSLIYTHCHPIYQKDRQLNVLDIACGRGADLNKFYYAKVDYYVGIDLDKNALTSAIDGAISRYNKFRRGKPAYPKMYFVQANAGALLNYEDQFRALSGMDKNNRDLMEKFFSAEQSKKVRFDRINCQFAMHYFLETNDTWKNYKTNLRNHLKAGGYYIATTFDGREVEKLIGDKDKFTINYTNNKGEKKILFEFVKKYEKIDMSKEFGTGHPIDVFMAWLFQEGNYMTEYLVDPKFLERELLEDCDLELVDTDLFGNIFEMQRGFFADYAQYEEVFETNKFFSHVKEYYNSNDDINNGCLWNTKVMRYYIFRRKDYNIDKSKKTKPTQNRLSKGGSQQVNLLDTSQFIINDTIVDKNKDMTYCASISNILKSHKLIPKSIAINNFLKDFKLTTKTDKEIDTKYMTDINNNLVIYNNIDGKDKQVLDGLHTLIVEPDCNGHYDVQYIKNNNKNTDKTVILYKENGSYKPVYKIANNDKKTGMLSLKDDVVQDLLKMTKN